MRDHYPGRIASIMQRDIDYSLPFVTNCYRNALEQLGGAFTESRPLAILIGEGNCGASYVINRFLADLLDDVDVARITGACTDPGAGMRQVIQAIGFDPGDMNHADLDSVLKMFLSFQRTHQRRTIICFEAIPDSDQWMLDRIRQLVELENKGRFGLMVIISGRPNLSLLFNERPLSAIVAHAKQPITLAPFTLSETAEYIRRRVGSAGTADISQVFEFHAISLIHELSEGVPDAVIRLCTKCLELKDEQGTATITPEMAKTAGSLLRLTTTMPRAEAEPASTQVDDSNARGGRLIATVNEEIVHELAVSRGHVLIGRDEACDIRLTSNTVSRYHALIVISPNIVRIVDLGSTNGTFAEGRRVTQHTLRDRDLVTIGDCTIEYTAGEGRQTLVFDTERTNLLESQGAYAAPARSGDSYGEQSLTPAIETMVTAHRRASR